MKIATTYDPKPIPDRRYDWSATHDDYEPGDPVGHGATEIEAIDDLMQQLNADPKYDHLEIF